MDPTPDHRDTTRSVPTPLPRDARRELALILTLFLALRLMSAWWFQPLYSEAQSFFFPFAWLQGAGYYPFFDYWLEYPPVLAYLLVGLREAAVWLGGRGTVAWERACFVRTVQVSSIVWETGSLGLVYALVRRLRGTRAAAKACWVYLALFSTAFVALSYVDSFPVFLMLVGLMLASQGRPVWSAIGLAGGFMAKVFPIVLLPTVWKSTARWRRRLAATGAFVLFVGYFSAPFLATGRHWLWHSLESMARRPPWETVWALLDGRYGFGYVGPMPGDMTPGFFEKYGVRAGVRGALHAVPAEVFGQGRMAGLHFYRVASRFARDLSFLGSRPPRRWFWWVYGGVGLLLGLFYLGVFARLPAELPPRRRVTFAAFSVLVFFFYSKGWSPQFALYLIPLVLIVLPVERAALWCLLLTATAFLEMPIWTHHLEGYPGRAASARLVLEVAVVARTLLLVGLAARLVPRLFRD